MRILTLSFLLLPIIDVSLAQTLIIHTTNQTPIQFPIADIDSITLSTTAYAPEAAGSTWHIINVTPENQIIAPEGTIMTTAEGLKIGGVQNRTVKALSPISTTSVQSRIIRLKWKLSGNVTTNARITFELGSDTLQNLLPVQIADFALNESIGLTKAIAGNVWYYSQIKINTHGAEMTTCLSDYADHQGSVIHKVFIPLIEPPTTCAIGLKASPSTFLLIAEKKEE